MADNFSGIERLLGLPQGSTNVKSEQISEVLANGVKNKTEQLNKELKKVDTLEGMQSASLVKIGISIEELEQDKATIRTESFEVYRIAKALLEKYQDDVKDRVDLSDRMYLAGGKLIDAITGSLEKLTNMILRFKQEAEMQKLTMVGENDDGKKEMNPTQWIDFVDTVKTKPKPEDDNNIKDAEIID
jgi:hypothetical protein